ncbi:MAG: DUF3037 domain-containing protein [Armatimonadetes bacterium]|nr:DUF3037 domain-containing protein [Armatimonadota bacterium]
MRVSYRYSVLRYQNDPAMGEALNIGVIFYCPDHNHLEVRISSRFKRLSDTFEGFDQEGYRRTVSLLERGVERLAAQIKTESAPSLIPPKMAAGLDEITGQLLPDTGLAYRFGPEMCGITRKPETEIEQLYEQFVTSRYSGDGQRKRREDSEVWNVFQEALRRRNLSHLVQERTIPLEDDLDYKFQHSLTLSEGTGKVRRAVLESVSFDYADKRNIRERVTEMLGLGQMLLGKEEEVGEVIFLVGPPQNPAMRSSYESGLKMLSHFQLPHKIFRENEVEQMADEVIPRLESGIVKK